MHAAHLALGARFRQEAAWMIADVYSSPDEEARAARAGVGLADVSAAARVAVRGEDAQAVVEKLTGQEAPPPGQARRGRLDGVEVVVCRVAPDEFLTLAGAGNQFIVADMVTTAARAVGCAHVTDVTSAYAALDIVGPRAPALLERLVPLDLSPAAMPALAVARAELARVRAILLRLDHPGLPALRALVPRECGAFVWDTVSEAGHDLGLVRVGAAAHALIMADR
jgi:sarcosine oxidase subunit alpha